MGRRFNWGTGIAIVYTAFACSTLGFVAFAMQRPVDLVSADYYERSLEQDDRLEAEANARSLAEPVTISIEGAGRLVVHWPASLSAATGSITLYRPSDAAADRTFPVLSQSGTQTVDVSDLAPGRWRLQLSWNAGGRRFYHEEVLTLP